MKSSDGLFDSRRTIAWRGNSTLTLVCYFALSEKLYFFICFSIGVLRLESCIAPGKH